MKILNIFPLIQVIFSNYINIFINIHLLILVVNSKIHKNILLQIMLVFQKRILKNGNSNSSFNVPACRFLNILCLNLKKNIDKDIK